jgi:ribosomal-protein-alanine N-acetyltransferase
VVASKPDRRAGGTRDPISGLVVVPMRRRHLRGVLAIEHLVYPHPWSPTLFVAELSRSDDRRYLVALASRGQVTLGDATGEGVLGRSGARSQVGPQVGLVRGALGGVRAVVGYAGVLVQAGEAHITTVAVHPHHHRRKVATRLLVELLAAARQLGAEAATLEVRVANRAAQRLYAGFGFAPVGVRPGYYAETTEDALIMWAHELQGEQYLALLRRQSERLTSPGGSSGAPDLDVPWVKGRIGLRAPLRNGALASDIGAEMEEDR